MNTCVRRFMLRLLVGLLTFAAGVAAAMLIGGINPFQSFASTPSYQYREYKNYQGLRPEPAYQYEYQGHSCRKKSRMTEQLPPPPPAEAPLPPSAR